MITSQIVSSSSVLTEYANTMEANGPYIYLTAILGAGSIVIDDIAIDVEPVSFFSPIKCTKIGTLGVSFLFYVTQSGISSRYIDYPAFLPGTLPMILQ
jgi:hypothetical protein